MTESRLRALTRTTLDYYEERAADFWEGTRDHDVSQNIESLLEAIGGDGPQRILDFGCGPGRDLVAFRERGHDPVGLDGAEAFVHMARLNSGAEVWHQDFLALDLPGERFDGVFANASLFHGPAEVLPRVLAELRACLRPGGVFVFDSGGKHLGTISPNEVPANVGWGENGETLYITARTSLYRIKLTTSGLGFPHQ